jgi:hypothetical protein
MVDRMRAMRRPGECYTDVVLRWALSARSGPLSRCILGRPSLRLSATLCALQPQPPAHARAYVSLRRLLGSVPLHFLSRCQALSDEIPI